MLREYGIADLEELEGHAKVWLDRPSDVSTIMFQVGKVAEQQLLPRPFLHVLQFRKTTDGKRHLNMVVGRVQIEDNFPEGSMFEYGITDQVAMPVSGRKKRIQDTFNMYVHACGPRAGSITNATFVHGF